MYSVNQNQSNQNFYGQNPSFKMRVELLPRHMDWKFNLLNKEEISKAPYTIKNIIRSSRALYSDNICDCNVLGLSNGKDAFLTHLIPDDKNLNSMQNFDAPAKLKQDVLESLQKNIDDLKSKGQEIKAFLVGGQVLEQQESRSISLFKELKEVLAKNDIKPTVLWGQGKDGKMQAFYNVKDDTLSLYPGCKISPSGLKKHFSTMQFNEGDEVLINGKKKINSKKLSKEDKSVLDINKTTENYSGKLNSLFNRVA